MREELVTESAAKAAAKLGLATGKEGKPPLSRAQCERSFGGNYEEYIAAYKDGKRQFDAKDDHEAWQEKRAAALQGRHYHE
jgi:hypothetical protein